ncbi:class I SAM-dependent methyltransferase [Streptococcaceae bacterium ESL0687]|nr:class I SAM-dependent methyltransferase [Streptococcaceae bacterium ESL0687]
MLRPLHLAHAWLKEVINPGDVAIDATMGNGHDTAFLAGLTDKVFAFDVQKQAVESTRVKLVAEGLTAELILSGHQNVDEYVDEPIKAAIFNLGYLPKSDKSVITLAPTTIEATSKILDKMVKGGRLAMMVYYGHAGGAEEKDLVLDFVSALPQTDYQVMNYGPLNQKNTPPFLIMIEKLI